MRPAGQAPARSLLSGAIATILAIHAGLLLVPGLDRIAVSRLSTAAMPVVAALCFLWRAQQLPVRERFPRRWLSLSLLLWAAGQVVEAFIGRSAQASVTTVDASDFLYMAAALPVLLAVSSTRRTESIRTVLALDSVQMALAFVLIYVRLFAMPLPPAAAQTLMARIYGADCALLAAAAALRLATWSTQEERRRVRLLCAVVWLYLPVELGMDYGSTHWGLHAGTMLDLLWSVPFAYAGWQALHLPISEDVERMRRIPVRWRLLIESLCPVLMTAAVFVLAASVAALHLALALVSAFLLLAIQSLHASMVQLNYAAGQHTLMEREHELQAANTRLQQLSLSDPLTGIPNRRRFTAALDDAWRRGLRRREPIAVLMIDVGFFKDVNDLKGHVHGDECLVRIARILGRETGRPDDLLARYGAEEFVVLLPATGEGGARNVGERMRQAVMAQDIANDASPFERKLTVSVGIGTAAPERGVSPAALVETADQALYEAKRLGRNRICARRL